MAKVDTQSIPSVLEKNYTSTLIKSKTVRTKNIVVKRTPFKLPKWQQPSKDQPDYSYYKRSMSPKRWKVRTNFGAACRCFNKQPDTGGVEPPEKGYRNRTWWYNAAVGSGLFYFNYFMQQTLNSLKTGKAPIWCDAGNPTLWALAEDFPDQVNADSSYAYLTDSDDPIRRRVAIQRVPPLMLLSFFRENIYIDGIPPYEGFLPCIWKFYEIKTPWQGPPLGEGPTWNNTPVIGDPFYTVDWEAHGDPYDPEWLTVEVSCPIGIIITCERKGAWPAGYNLETRINDQDDEDTSLWPFWSP
jgi:hypothetical protein